MMTKEYGEAVRRVIGLRKDCKMTQFDITAKPADIVRMRIDLIMPDDFLARVDAEIREPTDGAPDVKALLVRCKDGYQALRRLYDETPEGSVALAGIGADMSDYDAFLAQLDAAVAKL